VFVNVTWIIKIVSLANKTKASFRREGLEGNYVAFNSYVTMCLCAMTLLKCFPV
jgi:hypothetical protein